MARQNATSGSIETSLLFQPQSNRVQFARRTSSGGTTSTTNSTTSGSSYWVRIVRNGTTLTTYKSSNGTSWTLVGSVTVSSDRSDSRWFGSNKWFHDNHQDGNL